MGAKKKIVIPMILFCCSILIGLIGAGFAAAAPVYFSRGALVFWGVVLVLFTTILIWWLKSWQKKYEKAERWLRHQSLAFQLWFTGHNLFWALCGSFFIVALMMVFGPGLWVLLIVSGTLACIFLATVGVFLVKQQKMLGLCWRSSIPDGLRNFWGRTAAIMILGKRYDYAVEADKEQHTPVLWSISRIFSRAKTGGAERPIDLMGKDFPKEKLKKEWFHRLKTLGILFGITIALALLIHMLGLINLKAAGHVPGDGWLLSKVIESRVNDPTTGIITKDKDILESEREIGKSLGPPEKETRHDKISRDQEERLKIDKGTSGGDRFAANSNQDNAKYSQDGKNSVNDGSSQSSSAPDQGQQYGPGKGKDTSQAAGDSNQWDSSGAQKGSDTGDKSGESAEHSQWTRQQDKKGQTNEAGSGDKGTGKPGQNMPGQDQHDQPQRNKKDGTDASQNQGQQPQDRKSGSPKQQSNKMNNSNRQGSSSCQGQKGQSSGQPKKSGSTSQSSSSQQPGSEKGKNAGKQGAGDSSQGKTKTGQQKQGQGMTKNSGSQGQCNSGQGGLNQGQKKQGSGQRPGKSQQGAGGKAPSAQGKTKDGKGNSPTNQAQNQSNRDQAPGKAERNYGLGKHTPATGSAVQPKPTLPSRKTAMVFLDLPPLNQKQGKGEFSGILDIKNSSKNIPRAPTGQLKKGEQKPEASKPDQFLPNWILILLKEMEK